MYAEPSSVNLSEGFDNVFVYIQGQVPIFVPMLLLTFFMIVMLGGFFSQRRLIGEGQFVMWMAIAGYLTAGLAFLMTLAEGLINLTTLIIVITIAIFSTVLFLLTRD